MYPSFIKYVKSFDIFLLQETFVTPDKYENFLNVFGGFDLTWVPAKRTSVYGRASGGGLYGLNKDVKHKVNVNFKNINNLEILQLHQVNGKINIIPVYINYNHWEVEYQKIKEMVEENNMDKCILLGDCNIRMGRLQSFDNEIEFNNVNIRQIRNSKDSVVNSRGKKLVDWFDNRGMLILNGRTLGDEEGEMTFVSKQGEAVNDVCAISYELLDSVSKFSVGSQTLSDHLPIELKLNLRYNTVNKDMKLLPKLVWRNESKNIYLRRLEENLKKVEQSNRPLTSELLVSVVQNSAIVSKNRSEINPKQKWYNRACEKARTRSFESLNLWRSLTNNSAKSIARDIYIKYNKIYKQTCIQQRKNYYVSLYNKIGRVKDSKEWWSLAKQIKNVKFRCGSDISSAELARYFETLLNPQTYVESISYAENFVTNDILDSEIIIDEIEIVLNKAKKNKAPGEDRVPYEFYVNASAMFKEKMVLVYNKIMEEGAVEDGYLKSIIFPVFKKGNRNEVQNYRGISFMNVVAKIFVGVLKNRLALWEHEAKILNEYQAGFRKGYSTNDNIFNLVNIIQIKMNDNRKVYCFFVDFRAAFDSVDRGTLFYKLHLMGVSTKFLRVLRAMYEGTRAAAWDGEHISEWFQTSMGVKQGCILSPDLFAFLINDLYDNLGNGGVRIEELLIKILLYADDLVIMAEDIAALQEMINKFASYCKKWNLVVNLDKSKIMIFKKGGRRSREERWWLDGVEIEIVNKYKYLGTLLTPKLAMRENILERVKLAKYSINSTWKWFLTNTEIAFYPKYELFKAVCRSIVCYGSQVWGYEQYEELEKFQRYFIRLVLGLPERTPKYMIRLETGLDNMFAYTLKCHMEYMIKILHVYGDDRLPKILAKIALRKKVGWVRNWEKIARKCSIDVSNIWSSQNTMRTKGREILARLGEQNKSEALVNASQSSYYIYRQLNYDTSTKYVTKFQNPRKVRWIFKARGGLIGLNSSIWREGERQLCTLCNTRKIEDIVHFLGVCPILSYWRIKYFKVPELSLVQCLNILNGVDNSWNNLHLYLVDAWRYRLILINEYNT